MSITDSIKRAPRWAWYTSGGVVVGAVALRLWKNRTTADGETPLPGAENDPSVIGSYDYGTAGVSGGTGGVIVPPVIIGGNGDSESGGSGLFDLQSLYFGGVGQLFDQFQTLFAQDEQHYQTWVDATGASNQHVTDVLTSVIASAGSAPQPAAVNPTPVYVTVNPAPSAPVVTASSPQPGTTRSCPDIYGYIYPHHNPANGVPSAKSCFRNHCKDHSEWHEYADGHNVHDGDKCPTNGQYY